METQIQNLLFLREIEDWTYDMIQWRDAVLATLQLGISQHQRIVYETQLA
jgi:hypothetical protein